MAALASGRQRQLVAEAQAVAGELKELPPASAASASQNDFALQKLAELARLIKKLRASTAQLTDETSKPMWEQRSLWMHQELIELAAERLQGGDPSLYWNNVANLMYAGAAGHEAALQEKNALQGQVEKLEAELEAKRREADGLQQQLAASEAQVKELQERIESHAAASAASAAQQETGASSGEVMELRTKLMVAQQELQRRNSEREDVVSGAGHHAWTPPEKQALEKRLRELSEQNEEHRVEEARQSAVITTLMQESEMIKKRMEAANTKAAEVNQHNHTLSVNLETHASVVEKLIELNTELMDSMNNRAFGHTTPAPAGPSGAMGNGAMPPGAAGGGGNAGLSDVVVAVEGSGNPSRAPPQQPQAPSFTDALQDFLTDDFQPPRKANASVLSSAPHANGHGHSVHHPQPMMGHRHQGAVPNGGSSEAAGGPAASSGNGSLMAGLGRFHALGGALSKAAAFVSGSDQVVEVLPVSTTISGNSFSAGGVDSPVAVV